MRSLRRMPVLAGVPPHPAGDEISRGSLAIRRADWEAYEHLHHGLEELGAPRVVLVTGADARTRVRVATGLGTAAALAGRRTLVMECDLAEPRLADLVGLERGPGLREYLCWAAGAAELLQPVALDGVAAERSEGAARLVFITAGRAAVNGAALLVNESFPAALGKIRKVYDLVVLPAGGLPSPDLSAVAGEVDAMLICTSEEASEGRSPELDAAVEDLPDIPAGLVVSR